VADARPDEQAQRQGDHSGRILELEIRGYEHSDEDSTRYGRRWVATLSRGIESMRVTIERVA